MRQPRVVITGKSRPPAQAVTKKPSKGPLTAEKLVVAALDQDRPRYLCKDKRGFHVVTLDQDKAITFESRSAAALALDDFTAKSSTAAWAGGFQIWAMRTRTTFEPV
jgi:hypothetical protein